MLFYLNKKKKYAGQEKNTGQLFFHRESIYKIPKLKHAGFLSYGMHKKAWWTDKRMDGLTKAK